MKSQDMKTNTTYHTKDNDKSNFSLDGQETTELLTLLRKMNEKEDDDIAKRVSKGLYRRVVEISNPFNY